MLFALTGELGFNEYRREIWGRRARREVRLIYMEFDDVVDEKAGERTGGSFHLTIGPELEQYLMKKLNKQLGALGFIKKRKITLVIE